MTMTTEEVYSDQYSYTRRVDLSRYIAKLFEDQDVLELMEMVSREDDHHDFLDFLVDRQAAIRQTVAALFRVDIEEI